MLMHIQETGGVFLIKCNFPFCQALTTTRNLDGIEELPSGLTSLELGECISMSRDFPQKVLSYLLQLTRLRLEKGQGDCPTIALLETVADLPRLSQLELINFDIKPGFDKAIAKCSNLKTLLIIPTYVTQVISSLCS